MGKKKKRTLPPALRENADRVKAGKKPGRRKRTGKGKK